MAGKQKKDKPPTGANDLVRVAAGAYRTGDDRFEIEKSDVGWYLVDTHQANEFGQQLIHGPMATLDQVREAIPGAREIRPLLRIRPKKLKSPTGRDEPHAPPPSWIDNLPDSEAREVRTLIGALEKEGLDDAEELVKRHRDDRSALLAERLLEHRIKKATEDATDASLEIVRRVIDVLTNDGAHNPRPLPRWSLVETGRDDNTAPAIHPKV